MGSLAVAQPLQLECLHHHLQSNRSPVDSPPTAKKCLLSTSSCYKQHQKTSVNDNDLLAAGSENRSILKRVDCSRSQSWHAGQKPRRVNFHQNVAVVVYNRGDGEYVCYESHQLNTNPKDRRQFVSRTLLARVHSTQPTSSSFIDENSACTPPLAANGRRSEPGRPLPSSTTFSTTEYTFHEHDGGQLWLRFTVPVGRGVAAGDALVKSNVAGNKLRVLVRQQFALRFALPVDVDPYAISARMDSTGQLFVEAPVLTDRRHYQTTDTSLI